MGYALDQLGFLQFEQLVAALFDLEAGIAVDAWSGEADRCRSVLSETPIGRPLIGGSIPAAVLGALRVDSPRRTNATAPDGPDAGSGAFRGLGFPTLAEHSVSWQRASWRVRPADDPSPWGPSPSTRDARSSGLIDVDRVLQDL
jgi:hypothetical protein